MEKKGESNSFVDTLDLRKVLENIGENNSKVIQEKEENY